MYPLANKYSTGTLLPNSLMVISTEWYTYKVYCTECTLNKAYIHRVQSVLQVDLPNPFQTGKRQVSFDGRRQLQNVINTLGALQAQTYQHAMYTVTTASTDTDTQPCNQSHSITDMMQFTQHSRPVEVQHEDIPPQTHYRQVQGADQLTYDTEATVVQLNVRLAFIDTHLSHSITAQYNDIHSSTPISHYLILTVQPLPTQRPPRPFNQLY